MERISHETKLNGTQGGFREAGGVLTLATCHPLDSDPPQCEHGTVMVHVKERDLVVFLPQDEKHSIQILHSF